MPLVRIELPAGRDRAWRDAVADAVQDALHEALGVPLAERFQVVTEHAPGALSINPDYLGIRRSPGAVIVQVFLNRGRDADRKRAFFRALAARLDQQAAIAPADVVANLVEVGPGDWSFGHGEAQLADGSPPLPQEMS